MIGFGRQSYDSGGLLIQALERASASLSFAFQASTHVDEWMKGAQHVCLQLLINTKYKHLVPWPLCKRNIRGPHSISCSRTVPYSKIERQLLLET